MKKTLLHPLRSYDVIFINMKYVHFTSIYWVGEEED